MQTLYRALYTDEHRKLWNEGKFNSSHHMAPGEWFAIWKERQSVDPNDYPLTVQSGVYTMEAVRKFISLSLAKSGEQWSSEENRKVGELAGACAFITPEAAWDYGHNTLEGQLSLERYVEFEGDILCPVPEDCGMVATVRNVTAGPMSATDFKTRHNL